VISIGSFISTAKLSPFGSTQTMVQNLYFLAVPVLDFYADNTQKDDDLAKLIDFIQEIINEKNVQPILEEKFGIQLALDESNMI